jgi:hypothetical protein
MFRTNFAIALGLLLVAISAQAATDQDGVTLINQATVMAAGGFPFKITQSGSYRLTSNLVLPEGSGANGIEILTDNVTLDLNGFSLLAPVCSANPQNTCGRAAISGTPPLHHQTAVSIRNGSILGWSYGVFMMQCMGCSVQQLSIHDDPGPIALGFYARVSGNVLTNDTGLQATAGITTAEQAIVEGNIVSGFTQWAISTEINSRLSGNVVASNANGIEVACPSILLGNIAAGNGVDVNIAYGSGCESFNNKPGL